MDRLSPPRCPLCDASLEATRSQRMIPAAGAWKDQGRPHFVVRCANGHQGDGETLEKAVREIERGPGSAR